MNTRPITSGAGVVAISPDTPVQNNLVAASTGLRFVPISSTLSADVGFDAGLWALAEALEPGARLDIAWRFGRREKFNADVSLRIDHAMKLQSPSGGAEASYHPSLERAGLLALPGFVSCLEEKEHIPHRVQIVGPGADTVSPCVRSAEVRSNGRRSRRA
jgi:hypothetical protein